MDIDEIEREGRDLQSLQEDHDDPNLYRELRELREKQNEEYEKEFYVIMETRLKDGRKRDVTTMISPYSGFAEEECALAALAYYFIGMFYDEDSSDPPNMDDMKNEVIHVVNVMMDQHIEYKGCYYDIGKLPRIELQPNSLDEIEPWPHDDLYESDPTCCHYEPMDHYEPVWFD